jgi:ubiquinone/menaquinone biosynthesis C-methylase UbiE
MTEIRTMFSKTARYYDKFYAFKDYAGEAERLLAIIDDLLRSGDNLRPGGRQLLDVACGTGHHIDHLTLPLNAH